MRPIGDRGQLWRWHWSHPWATRAEILKAAQKDGKPEVFEKDGYVWVGRVGLKLDGAGHLVEVVPAWSPF